MPKVTEQYKKDKIDKIIECAIEVIMVKPLYELSMLDVIKKAGISKGGIYLYFKDIDELIIAVINTLSKEYDCTRKSTLFATVDNSQITKLKQTNDGELIKQSIIEMFESLGDYIDSCPRIISKIQFELIILLSSNPDRYKYIMPKLELKDLGSRFMEEVETLLRIGIEEELWKSEINIEMYMENISVYIDGMSQRMVFAKVYGNSILKGTVKEHFKQYAQSVLSGF